MMDAFVASYADPGTAETARRDQSLRGSEGSSYTFARPSAVGWSIGDGAGGRPVCSDRGRESAQCGRSSHLDGLRNGSMESTGGLITTRVDPAWDSDLV